VVSQAQSTVQDNMISPFVFFASCVAAVYQTAAIYLSFLWLALSVLFSALSCSSAVYASDTGPKKVGVIYIVHGSPNGLALSSIWDAAIQMASYDQHSALFRNVIWNPEAWSGLLELDNPARAEPILALYRKYTFQIGRIGGTDPATATTKLQVAQLRQALKGGGDKSIEFLVDWSSWIALGKDIPHHPFPRFMYNRNGAAPNAVTYCGSSSDGGIRPNNRWPNCDPERYNVDGPVDRLLARGAEAIILVDTTVGGVRFSKTFETISMLKRARNAALQGTDRQVQLMWVNDPTNLMTDSYPSQPANWTRSLGAPAKDRAIPLEGRGNPITDDAEYAKLVVDGIVAAMSLDVLPKDTAVLLFNHGLHKHSETFDPKVNDTIILNANIRNELLKTLPSMRVENILGGWMGVAEPVSTVIERTREMRGEDLGHAYLYETNQQMPQGDWGLRFWEALDQFRLNGAKHIVAAFPQIIVSSIPSVVEYPNQIAREIGYRSFLNLNELSEPRWPGFGNPFADYWPVAAPRWCSVDDGQSGSGIRSCCYQLGGCGRIDSYPEARTTSIGQPQKRLDPALIFDVPAFGHLGYDPKQGLPDESSPVQGQYRGTWSLYRPLDSDPRLAEYLARKVFDHWRLYGGQGGNESHVEWDKF